MNKNMRQRARDLRKKSTDAENYLWYFLRSRRFCEFKFRRQYVIDNYIVDFVCIKKQLIIELDGGQHAEALNYDAKRTAFLEAKGYVVLRFWNNEIFTETEGVINTIFNVLQTSKNTNPHPNPLPL